MKRSTNGHWLHRLLCIPFPHKKTRKTVGFAAFGTLVACFLKVLRYLCRCLALLLFAEAISHRELVNLLGRLGQTLSHARRVRLVDDGPVYQAGEGWTRHLRCCVQVVGQPDQRVCSAEGVWERTPHAPKLAAWPPERALAVFGTRSLSVTKSLACLDPGVLYCACYGAVCVFRRSNVIKSAAK